jgi:DNA-binding LacI/PurR family transcriptional regulator
MSSTILDIARKAKVSYTAVSDILNRGMEDRFSAHTIERVRRIALSLGYEANHFAQSLKKGKTNIIGIVNPGGVLFDHWDPYFSNVFMGLASFCARQDYKLVFLPLAENMAESRSSQRPGRMVDGLVYILLSSQLDAFQKEHAAYLKKLRVPFVLVTSFRNILPHPSVGVDCLAGGLAATRHLIEGHGYETVGFVLTQQQHEHHNELLAGYQQALRACGRSVMRRFIYRTDGIMDQDGYALGRQLAQERANLPRAIITVSYPMALGMLRGFREAGLSVPQDVALIAFGENLKEYEIAGLTIIEQPSAEKGRAAGELLYQLIEGKENTQMPESRILTPRLIIRQSCGSH